MNEAQLPGIGKKFWIDTESGEKLTVIRHNSGRYELYFFRKDEEVPCETVELSEYEARDLGSVLFGRFEHRVVETMDVVMEDLVIEWARVGDDSELAGKSIKEMEVRRKTGVSVVAIIRGEQGIPSPAPEEMIYASDLLLLIGDKKQIEKFKSTML